MRIVFLLFFISFYISKLFSQSPAGFGLHTYEGSQLCRLVRLSVDKLPWWRYGIFPDSTHDVVERLRSFQDYRYLSLVGKAKERFKKPGALRKYSDPLDLACVPHDASERVLSFFKQSHDRVRQQGASGGSQINNFEYDILLRKIAQLSTVINPADMPCSNKYLEVYTKKDMDFFIRHVKKSLGNASEHIVYCIPTPSGVEVKVYYANGVLQSSFAKVGEAKVDVTGLVRSLNGVPRIIPDQGNVEVKGVLTLKPRDLRQLNFSRRATGKKVWLDSYSAISDVLLYSSNPNRDLDLKVSFYAKEYGPYHKVPQSAQKHEQPDEDDDYNSDIFADDPSLGIEENDFIDRGEGDFNKSSPNYFDMYTTLGKYKFQVVPRSIIRRDSVDDLRKTIDKIFQVPLQFELGGIYVTLESDMERRFIKLAGAFVKKTPKLYTTHVKNISFQVLANGFITTTLTVDPVRVDGVDTTKFVLNSRQEYIDLDVRQGDSVVVITDPNGELRILKSLKDSKVRYIKFPKTCPRCSTRIIQMDVNGHKVECCPTHLTCTGEALGELLRFTSAQGFNISSITPFFAESLLSKYIISNPSDIFSLNTEDYKNFSGIDSSQFVKFVQEVKNSKKISLERFIYSLNLPGLTFLMAEELAHALGTLDNFLSLETLEVKSFHYVDKDVLRNLSNFLRNPRKRAEVHKILNWGVEVLDVDPTLSDLCFRNIDDYKKEDYEEIIRRIQEANRRNCLTDFSYDLLNETAEKIESKHKEWKLPRTLTPAKKKAVKWNDQIGVVKKTYSAKELQTMCSEIKGAVVVEPKINGVACTLQYKKGKLYRALTKHSPTVAYDITSYVMNLPNIPKTLERKLDISIRGELFINQKDFNRINEERGRSGKKAYVDSLGALVGTLHRNERDALVFDAVSFVAYHLASLGGATHEGLMSDIEDLSSLRGVNSLDGGILNFHKYFETALEAVQYATDSAQRIQEFPTSIDGMILKPFADKGLVSSKIFAYKFKMQSMLSKVLGVRFSLSKSGKVFAVAEVEPLKFENGRTVSSVNITDPSMFPLYVGDTISVTYIGGTVPAFEKVLLDRRPQNGQIIDLPSTCPECKTALIKKDSGFSFCTNQSCKRNSGVKKLLTFAKHMHMKGESVIPHLIDSGRIQYKEDFFKLIPEDLVQCDVSHEHKASFMASTQDLRSMDLSKLLIAVGIGKIEIEEEDFTKLAGQVTSIQDFKSLTKESLKRIGFTNQLASRMDSLIQKNQDFLSGAIAAGVTFKKPSKDNLLTIRKEFWEKQNDVYTMLSAVQAALNEQQDLNKKLLRYLEFESAASSSKQTRNTVRLAKWHDQKDQVLLRSLQKYTSSLEKTMEKFK